MIISHDAPGAPLMFRLPFDELRFVTRAAGNGSHR